MSLLSIVLVLYLIMDPVGNISSFLSQVKNKTVCEQRRIILREMCFALIPMLVFSLIGEYIFNVLDISEVTVRIASGVILFLAAFQILFPTLNSLRKNLPEDEPFVTPLAIPLIAGPSLLATIMLFSRMEESVYIMVGAIFIAWALALVTLILGRHLYRLIGENGLSALERMMGMILVLLAIQRFMSGIMLFIETQK